MQAPEEGNAQNSGEEFQIRIQNGEQEGVYGTDTNAAARAKDAA